MLSPREQQVLRVVINEYSNSAHPVGSHLVWQRYGLGISPATIRSVMSALTREGYLSQPHVSAGRVPTERAFRMFVEGAENASPTPGELEKLQSRIKKADSVVGAQNAFARLLAEVSGGVSLVQDAHGTRVFGLANAFGQAEFQDPRVASYLAEVIDQTEIWLPKLAQEKSKVAMRIGEENHDFRARQVSVLAIGNGSEYVAVIGSSRLPYQKVLTLLEAGFNQVAGRG
jgi:transcriptional regulator of heat shock response